jgi:hypothetical protein
MLTLFGVMFLANMVIVELKCIGINNREFFLKNPFENKYFLFPFQLDPQI